jgi:hypothetical protein
MLISSFRHDNTLTSPSGTWTWQLSSAYKNEAEMLPRQEELPEPANHQMMTACIQNEQHSLDLVVSMALLSHSRLLLAPRLLLLGLDKRNLLGE